MYALGKWFRERYSEFLPEEYSPKDVYIRSTDPDRCLMSAYAVLAGLFPPKGSQLWNNDLQWQPIPVHTSPVDKDEVLFMMKKCPRYKNLLEKTFTSDHFKEISFKFQDLLNYVATYSGWENVDLSHMSNLQSNVESYTSYNKSFISPWAKSLDAKTLDYLGGLHRQRYTLTPGMRRLRRGPFWSNFLAHFDNVVNGVKGTPKFLMLSAHDTTIVSVLNCVGAFDLVPPRFGSVVIWELRINNEQGIYYICLFYKSSDRELEVLKMGEHDVNYSEYNDFKELVAPLVLDGEKWEEECKDLTYEDVDDTPETKPFIVSDMHF